MGHKHHGHHGGMVFGLILIALGAAFLAERFIDLDAGALARTWWPVVLIVLGLKGFLGRGHGVFWPLFVTVVGGLFLARNLELLDHEIWGYVWPVGLVLLGLHVLTGPWRSRPCHAGPPAAPCG